MIPYVPFYVPNHLSDPPVVLGALGGSRVGVGRLVLVVVAVRVALDDIVATLGVRELLATGKGIVAAHVAAGLVDDVGALPNRRTANVEIHALVLRVVNGLLV